MQAGVDSARTRQSAPTCELFWRGDVGCVDCGAMNGDYARSVRAFCHLFQRGKDDTILKPILPEDAIYCSSSRSKPTNSAAIREHELNWMNL